MPERPATDEQLIAKFRGLATPVIGPAAAEALLDLALSGNRQPVQAVMKLCSSNCHPESLLSSAK